MAAADFGGTVDRQENRDRHRRRPEKPHVGATYRPPLVRQGQRRHIADLPTLRVTLAIQDLARSKQKAFLISGAAGIPPDRQGLRPDHGALDL